MEDLTRLVAESMARHGMEVLVDHRRLQWSEWVPLESRFDPLLVPSKPGLFALADELIAPGEMPMAAGKRMLAIFQISETADLGIAMVRLFAPGTPLTARWAEGRVFVRYTVIEDDAQRRSAHQALQRWLTASAETASGIMSKPDPQLSTATVPKNAKEAATTKPGSTAFKSEVDQPAPLPAGF
jgi:hypothetical protein